MDTRQQIEAAFDDYHAKMKKSNVKSASKSLYDVTRLIVKLIDERADPAHNETAATETTEENPTKRALDRADDDGMRDHKEEKKAREESAKPSKRRRS